MAVFKSSVHHMNQNSPSVFSSVNKTLVVEHDHQLTFYPSADFSSLNQR